MGFAGRLAAALASTLLLSACLLTPGKFTSTLDIKRDRSFTFTYVGEVIAQPPSSGTDGNSVAPGSPSADTADLDPVMMQIDATKKLAPPATDPAAKDAQKMHALAEALSKEYGYRSVKYLGNYRFAVDYQVSGRLTHSFLFPFNIDGEVIVPFLAIELRDKDRIRLKAPGFANDDSKGLNMPGMGGMGGGMGSPQDKDAANALDGTFTVTTDAEIISQNQENGAQTLPDGRKRIVWRATPQTKDAPTAVFRFEAMP